eukprot:NODE_72_length_24857_cov_0.454399.p13 type:complete len:214 gc:universal NODE_72_length_24857_cov_0.454399:1654-2295(+)
MLKRCVRCFWKQVTNPQEHQKERDRIKREFREGYWHDFKVLNATNGKLFEPKPNLHLSIKCPDLSVYDANTKHVQLLDVLKEKPTFLGVVFNEFANLQLKEYKSFYDSQLSQMNPQLQFVQLNVEENWLKSVILNMLKYSLKSKIPQKDHSTYLTSTFHKIYDFKEHLGIINKYVPWMYLINKQGIVRWQIHGKSSETELHLLKSLTKQVILE